MQPPERPAVISLWDFLALMGFGALWVFYLQVVPSLPPLVPTHFDVRGVANGWTPKPMLPWVIFGLPLLIWGVTTLQGIVTASRQEDPAKARAMAMQPLRGCLGLGLSALMASCLQASASGPRIILLGVAGLIACLAVGIGFMVRDFKGLPRANVGAEYYKWGMFYVNPDDRRVFVEKRLGIGYTVNFARPGAWLFLLVLLLPVVLAVTLAKLAH